MKQELLQESLEQFPIAMGTLPEGWSSTLLVDVAHDISPGFASGKHVSDGKGHPHMRPMNIDRNGKVDLAAVKSVPSSEGRTLAPGDVLFNNTNSPDLVGKTALIGERETGFAFSNHMTRIRAEKDVSPGYLAHYLHFLWMSGYLKHRCTNHVNQASISSTTLAQTVPLLVPPSSEQIRIVDKLEGLLSDLDASVAELKAAQRKLAQCRQSLLQAAVAPYDRNASWGEAALGDLVISISQGWSPRCEDGAVDHGWSVIKTTAIQPMCFDGSHNKKLPVNLEPREHLELQPGDLLVTRAGPRSRVGITCLVREVREKLLLCDKAYRVRCDESRISPSFLELVLNSPGFMNEIDGLKTGINDSGLNLTQDRFFSLLIPLPPVEEQARIVEVMAAQTRAISSQNEAIAEGLAQVAAQRKNILKAAFAGQLVPQDPNDEPASELLARIRAERAAIGTNKSVGRGPKTKEGS